MGEFNNIFKAPRQNRGYSQAHLSEALAISKRSISMYENGNRKPDYETLKKSLISSMRI